MVQAAPAQFWTLEAYLAYDDGTDTRYELENGVLVAMPIESPENCGLARLLFLELAKHVPGLLLHYKDIELEVSGRRAQVRMPDLMLLTEEGHAARQGQTRNIITRDMPPPALVIEVVSPGTTNRLRDYRYKRTEYAARGIAEYWIVDGEEQRITVCQWIDGAYEDRVLMGDAPLASAVIPSCQLTVAQILALGR